MSLDIVNLLWQVFSFTIDILVNYNKFIKNIKSYLNQELSKFSVSRNYMLEERPKQKYFENYSLQCNIAW
jgi:hypothetical protein